MRHSVRLSIYLNDHLALASAARELARRAAESNRGTAYSPFLAELQDQLTADRRVLRELMGELGIKVDRAKVLAAWGGERLGRFKLNGQLRGYSPLSRVVELEGLGLMLQANLALWRTVDDLGTGEGPYAPSLMRFAAGERARQAEARLAELPQHQARAAAEAFGAPGAGPVSVSRGGE